jgi:hypothetical protein
MTKEEDRPKEVWVKTGRGKWLPIVLFPNGYREWRFHREETNLYGAVGNARWVPNQFEAGSISFSKPTGRPSSTTSGVQYTSDPPVILPHEDV